MQETIQNPEKKSNTPYVRSLIIVVLLLGALLVAGSVLVIGTIIKRLNNPAPPPVASPAEVVINLPQGQAIEKVETNDKHIIVYTKAAIIIIDAQSGAEVKRIIFTH